MSICHLAVRGARARGASFLDGSQRLQAWLVLGTAVAESTVRRDRQNDGVSGLSLRDRLLTFRGGDVRLEFATIDIPRALLLSRAEGVRFVFAKPAQSADRNVTDGVRFADRELYGQIMSRSNRIDEFLNAVAEQLHEVRAGRASSQDCQLGLPAIDERERRIGNY